VSVFQSNLNDVGDNKSWRLNSYLGVLVELVSGNVVDGEDDLDVVLLSLLKKGRGLGSSVGVVERVTDL
jgi:hypothetical protein